MNRADGRIIAVSGMQERLDYGARVDGQPAYKGIAAPGIGEDQPSWLIEYLEYDGSDRFVKKTVAVGVAWDDRATATYR